MFFYVYQKVGVLLAYQEPWYSNKELFEMVQNSNKEVSSEIKSLKDELTSTREAVRKYNNLVEKMHNTDAKLEIACLDLKSVERRLSEKANKSEGKREAWQDIKAWTPWVLAVASILFAAWSWKGGSL